MNKFLTKEQAEYLIEQLCKTNRRQATECGALVEIQRAEDIKEIIYQCTEPEFPAIEMVVHGTKIIFTLADGVYTIHLELVDALESAWVRLDYPTFKVLAKDINKIVDWIDEQE